MKWVACLVVMLAGVSPARAAEQPRATVVRAVQIVQDGGITRVTIDADGPLPVPLHEPLTDPPRIYFDFEGVTHKVTGPTASTSGGVVRRARVALRQVSPNVTRVVLDLTRPEAYSVNDDERLSGRIGVLIGAESALPATREAVRPPAAPTSANPSSTPGPPSPVPAAPAPRVPAGNVTPPIADAPATAAPTPPPAIATPSRARSPVLSPEAPRPALPVREVQAYRKQISGELERLEALRTVLARIDVGEIVGADSLKLTAQEFADLRRALEAVKPSVVLAVTHDLLMTSCTFGAMASRFGIEAALENNEENRQRAASAAAGSLMLFDRACADLGCATPR